MSRPNDLLQPEFGAALRALRTDRGFSQEALAEACQLHWTYISQLERGLKSPSLATITALARALDMRASDLVRAAEEA